jgi:PAS domain-containing protein
MESSNLAGIEKVLQTGETSAGEDVLWMTHRRGFAEEAYFTFSHSPVFDDEGRVGGVLDVSTETTPRVLAERRLNTLRALAAITAGVETPIQACEHAARCLDENPRDLPFALFYLLDELGARANLRAWTGLKPGGDAAPYCLDVRGGHPAWPLGQVLSAAAPVRIEDLPARFPGFHTGPWPEPPAAALLLPLCPSPKERPAGVLVAGLSPRLPWEAPYRSFLELVAGQVSAGLAEGKVRQRGRERLERLAELDRAKTEFFSNVSHEFRTPLTLLLAPLEDLRHRSGELPAPLAEEIEVASRHTRRLLTLVNTLLDFSQLEAGRLRLQFEPTDLATLRAPDRDRQCRRPAHARHCPAARRTLVRHLRPGRPDRRAGAFREARRAVPPVLQCLCVPGRQSGATQGRDSVTDSRGGTWLQRYIFPDDQPRVKAVIDEAIRMKRVFELEHRVRRADGSVGWTFSRAVPLLDENGNIVEWFGAASDITERKQA